MAFLDPSDLAFHGDEAREFKDAIFDKVYPSLELSDTCMIVEDIVALKQVPILGLAPISGRKHDLSNAAPAVNGGSQVNRQKFWNPYPISDRFTESWSNLLSQFYVWAELKGYKRPDLQTTDIWGFIQEKVTQAIILGGFRHSWFGDVNANTVANGGVLTNGTDISFFNAINGLWEQIFAGVTRNTILNCNGSGTTFGFTSRNGQANYAAQAFTSTDVTNNIVNNTFRQMLAQADSRLVTNGGLEFIVTRSVASQYKTERETNYPYIPKAYDRTEGGYGQAGDVSTYLTGMNFDGVPIKVQLEWDRVIQTYQDNGTSWNLPHRAILSTKQNMMIGFDDEGGLTDWEAFYHPVDKMNYMDYMYMLSAMEALDYMVVGAY